MPRPPHTRIAGLAAAAIVAAGLPAPTALAAPTPQPPSGASPSTAALPAQPAVEPGHLRLSVPAASGSFTEAGTTRTVVAALAPRSAGFSLVGLTWSRLSGDVRLEVRVRAGSTWGAWQVLESEGNEGGRPGTDPVFTGPSTGVQVRASVPQGSTGSVTGLRASLIDSRTQAADTELPQRVQAASASTAKVSMAAGTGNGLPAQPTVISRAAWGADESLLRVNGSDCVTATIDPTIKAAVVHHTQGSNSYTAAQSASIVRGIYAYHVLDRGWCDVGYNFLVDKYGQVFEGRHGGITLPVHGAHATLWNTNTVGVSVMMNSMTAKQTPAAMDSLSNVLAWKLAGNYRGPNDTLVLAGKKVNRIMRHGDVMSTDCPGTNITAYMPTLRQQVAAKMGNWQTPIHQAWQAAGGETGPLGSPHELERDWNGGRTTTFTGGGVFQLPDGSTRTLGLATTTLYLAPGSFEALGWPTASEQPGQVAGSTTTSFDKGTVIASSATGAHATTGAVDALLRARPATLAAIGLPVADAVASDATSGSQQFQRGSISWKGSVATVQRNAGRMGDQDQDGRADLVAVASDGRVTWYPTGSSGRSGAGQAGSTLSGAPFSWLGQMPDLDKDGHSDLLARRSDGTLWAWRGQGNGQFGGGRQVGHGWNGMRQLVVVPSMVPGSPMALVGINRNQELVRYTFGTDLRVTSTTVIGRGWGQMRTLATVGDIRQVGAMDLLAIDDAGNLWDYWMTRDGRSAGRRTQVGHGWGSMGDVRGVGDMTGDGVMDLTARSKSGPMYLYGNKLQGRWAPRVTMLDSAIGLGHIS